MLFNDRRQPTFKNPAVGAAARAGSIKDLGPKVEKVPMENISKMGTRFFGAATTKTNKPKMVVPGSKKAAKLQKKSEWARDYEAKSDAKYDARMKAARAKREANKK